jgi:hypothetical protein
VSSRENHLKKVFRSLAFAAAVVIGFQNCDQSRLALMTELASAKSDGEICAIEPTIQASYTKILFVVDKSGSNVNPGTDPNGMYRVGTISAFYDLHKTNQFTKWGLVSFQLSGATPVILDDTGLSGGFSNDPSVIMPAIQSLATGNTGGTPYQAAIATAGATITNDIARNPNQPSRYVVVFISDGEPSDGVTDPVLQNIVTGLTDLGDITLSTVYYGPLNPTASARMLKMANWGRGKFLDTNVSGRIPLDSLIGSIQVSRG